MNDRSKAVKALLTSLRDVAKLGLGVMVLVWFRWTPTTEGGIVAYVALTVAMIVLVVFFHDDEPEAQEASSYDLNRAADSAPKSEEKASSGPLQGA
jgi:hypothetical protein